jgi:TolA-binding protein
LLALSLACAGATAAAIALLSMHRTAPERTWTSQSQPLTLALDDGSHLQLRPGSDVSLLRQRKGEVRLQVVRGGARFEVRHDPARRFQVTAAGVDVVVTGTTFSVELEGGLGVPHVLVERGEVEVHPQGEARLLARLHAGEAWPPRPAPSVASPEAPVPSSAVQPLEPQPAAPGVAPAVSPSAPLGGRGSAPTDSRQLLEQANAARRRGDVAEAASLLETLRVRYPRDPRAALASFELGRLRLDVLGDLPGAVQALKQSIALAPSGVFREDAEACLATAYARMRDRPRCEDARRTYLGRYPEGTHAAEMSALVCR